MRQKNITGSTLQVMIDPPIDVAPGDEIDHDELLAGFEPVGRKAKAEVAAAAKEDNKPDDSKDDTKSGEGVTK